MEKEPVTLIGLEKLKKELEELKRIKRPQIVEAIAEARAHGDLKENAEYHAAKEEQSKIEGRIVYINDLIRLTNKIENNPSCFGKILNICSGKETKVSELIFAIENSLNKKLTILEQASTKGDIKRMIGCNNLLKEITGIKTETNIKDGLNQMIEALNANKYFE